MQIDCNQEERDDEVLHSRTKRNDSYGYESETDKSREESSCLLPQQKISPKDGGDHLFVSSSKESSIQALLGRVPEEVSQETVLSHHQDQDSFRTTCDEYFSQRNLHDNNNLMEGKKNKIVQDNVTRNVDEEDTKTMTDDKKRRKREIVMRREEYRPTMTTTTTWTPGIIRHSRHPSLHHRRRDHDEVELVVFIVDTDSQSDEDNSQSRDELEYLSSSTDTK
jgi:hypothetical protein